MELFEPSDKVLEIICSKDEKPLTHYEVYPFGSYNEMGKNQGLYLSGVKEKILGFYGMSLEGNREGVDLWKILYLNDEIFKNWLDHSDEGSNLMVGLFFGSRGIGYGFYDGGDFFKDSKTKRQLEEKISFKEFDKNPRGKTGGHGFSKVYEFSDLIEVDSEKGVLYCVQKKENLIAPEGENAKEYFYNLRKNK